MNKKGGAVDKKTYEISVQGCDDASVFKMELTKAEYEVIKRVCGECTATSTYNCMPTMDISEIQA